MVDSMNKLIVALVAVAFFSACETLKGAGRDVESAGEEMDEAINEEDAN